MLGIGRHGARHPEQGRLVEVAADELHRQRQARGAEPRQHGNRGMARDVERRARLPAYRLVPMQGRRFRIAELDGYSLEFRGDAAVDEIIFHQPNGTFVATLVED